MKRKQRRLSPGVGVVTYRSGRQVVRYRWTCEKTGKREVATFDTVDEAESFRLSLLNDPARDAASRNMPFSAWWEQWMGTRDLGHSTRKGYESLATNHILPALGDLPLAAIRVSHLVSLHSVMLNERKLSSSHSNKAIEQIGACLNDALAEGILTKNPAKSMPRRKGATQRKTRGDQYALEPGEVLALEQAMDDHWCLIVPFLAETGLRIGELAALTVSDVDLADGRVRVDKSRKKTGEVGPPKSRAGYRVVPTLTEWTCERVAALIASRGLMARDCLFQGPRGAVLVDNYVRLLNEASGQSWTGYVDVYSP